MAAPKRHRAEAWWTKQSRVTRSLICVLLLQALLFVVLQLSGAYTVQDWKQLLGDSPHADADFAVHFINVGQGDCIYIHCGEDDVLIDAGEVEYGDTVVQYLNTCKVTSLDYVIATHPHSDHIGGLPAVLESFPVGAVLMSDIPDDNLPATRSYEQLLKAIDAAAAPLVTAEPGQTYQIGAAVLRILGPVHTDYDDLNNDSVVAQLTYGTVDFLLTGDMSAAAEKDLLEAEALSPVEVLKVGHHGSSTSSTKKFLKAVSPQYCVISCGDNSYNHPNSATVNRLEGYTTEIYRTDVQGTTVFTSDGRELTVSTEQKGSNG